MKWKNKQKNDENQSIFLKMRVSCSEKNSVILFLNSSFDGGIYIFYNFDTTIP